MQTKGAKIPFLMERLGEDELGSVLRRLSNQQDRKSCSEVCSRWKLVEGLTRTSLSVLDPEPLRRFLPRFPNLLSLEVGDRITDDDLKFIADTCRSLQTLDLNRRRTHRFTEDPEESPSSPDLEEFGDDGLCAVSTTCRGLTRVSLRKRKGIGVTGVSSLVEFARNLEVLDLSWCGKIDDRALEAIGGGSSSLRALSLHGCSLVTDRGLGFLASASLCVTLRKLILSECDKITDTGVLLLQRMSGLEELSLADCGTRITDIGGVAIGAIRGLLRLDVSWLINLSDVTLVALACNCENLAALNLTGCELVTGAGVGSFAGHQALACLSVVSCCVSVEDVAQVVLACPELSCVELSRSLRGWMLGPVEEKLSSLCRLIWV